MSLKAVHILFIIASTLLCFGFSAWAFQAYSNEEMGKTGHLAMAATSGLLGVGLLVYGRYFLKKLRHVSYL